ncbi:hypothetical protein HDC36_000901 [Xanthomonas sp. JAI131]|jgi:hypothetical protein|uniref:DUF1097 domain-containing protein n=1 Tax=Xanthomonas sp. JAI131 TaxID=2723067 RepID=UPI0015CAE5D7|nr:DUF1097 domain-containing protein [Xanthomonas sp. JAI131]NYF19464.1 hypothetical protein [Xanthomonas sp. JAI131]
MRHDASVARELKITLGESVVATLAATVSTLVLEVPVWAMFVGWISYFTRGVNLRQGLINLTCVFVGLGLGIAAGAATQVLTPHLGSATLTAVVFAVSVLVLSLRHLPVFNNLLGFFLGLVAFFASHKPPSWSAFTELGLAAAVGAAAAGIAVVLQRLALRADARA